MTKREAKRLMCKYVSDVLMMDWLPHYMMYDTDNEPRSDADVRRLVDASDELMREMYRRSKS